MAWDFYEPYEEDGKEADLKWYFCTFYYAKKPDNMKGGMIGMIIYKKRNTSSFRNHVVTDHKRILSHFVSYIDGRPKIWLVVIPDPFREVWIPLYHVGKFQTMSPLALV